jgi:very-short-patch-repair endonuclease
MAARGAETADGGQEVAVPRQKSAVPRQKSAVPRQKSAVRRAGQFIAPVPPGRHTDRVIPPVPPGRHTDRVIAPVPPGRHTDRVIPPAPPGRRADRIIARLAVDQHGVVTRRQLLAAGIGSDMVRRRVSSERLRRIHQGVYIVGPVTAPRAREMAAVLACGDAAVLSHGSAATLWQVLNGAHEGAPEVIDSESRHRHPGIRIHHIRTLRADEVAKLDGIPITTATRTLYDLASTVSHRDLERAVAEALARRLTSLSRLAKLLERHPRGRGAANLRAVTERGNPAFTRSEAEERFLALVRDARLEAPEVNVDVAGYEVDFLWRERRLIVEVDGYTFHSSPDAFERDRERDSVLAAAGLRVTRLTWKQLTEEPVAVIARLARALARPGFPPPPRPGDGGTGGRGAPAVNRPPGTPPSRR